MFFFKRKDNNIFSKIWWECDKVILCCVILLLLIGIVLVLTTSMFVALRIGVGSFYFIKNHFIYLGASICIFFIIVTRSREQLIKIAIIGMLLSVVALVYIVFFGQEIKGAKRWIYILGLSAQPSEFAKIFFPVVFAVTLQRLKEKEQNMFLIYGILSIIYASIIGLLLMQPDVGMSFLISVVFAILLFLMGISFTWIVGLMIIGVTLLLFSYFTFSHVNYRVNSFLSEQNTYQVERALQSLQGGNFFGKGAGQGLIKEYLPDSHTDFIFTVGVEEFGWFLGVVIIAIYLIVLYRGLIFLRQEKNLFNYFSVAGLTFLIVIQAIIHISSNINLIPTKGMTLPMISYGGSSLISMALGVSFLIALTKKDINNIILDTTAIKEENVNTSIEEKEIE